ncbi:MAG: manganese efflux pump MntP family protein [Sphaerochaetaceae bacterium]|nr:manganese efflux pump MntP family protein [Spirochaetales bacterium]MDY5499509.1 manganese efflux pump MntP family protein [Sphaerochaetaceae bacterium]
MSIVAFVAFGVSLSMDAFAISMVKGLTMKKLSWGWTFVIAFFFGGFQFLMPVAGYLLGVQFQTYITAIDHWIAFVLLAFIGGKMIWESLHEKTCEKRQEEKKLEHLDVRELFILAIATSIDALAVGITFAFLSVNILEASLIIGIVTFLICVCGVLIGHLFGTRFEKGAQILGGSVLILMGLKILLEHLGILTL